METESTHFSLCQGSWRTKILKSHLNYGRQTYHAFFAGNSFNDCKSRFFPPGRLKLLVVSHLIVWHIVYAFCLACSSLSVRPYLQ